MKARIALLFLLLALPVTGFGQTTILNFPRSFTPSDLGSTGFAVVNPSPFPADVTFRLYNALGQTLGTSDQQVEGRGQLAKLGSDLFSSAAQSGWVEAQSSTVGLRAFWVGGDFTNIMDGAEAAPFAQELIFPLITASTELNIVNLDTEPNNVSIRVYGETGNELGAIQRTIDAKGILQSGVTSLLPSVGFSNARYIRATGTGNISGATVVTDFIHGPSWSVVNGIDTSLTQTEANFPHVPSGPESAAARWTSIVGVTNFSTSPQTVTVTYNSVSGSSTSVARSLAGRGSLRESVKDLFGFGAAGEDGWVKVSGSAPLSGFVAYGYNATGGVAVVPVQATPRTTLIFSHVATGALWYTGLALLNPTNATANIEVFVMRDTGLLVGGAQDALTASITLPARTKIARQLNDLVPASVNDGGFVFVRSTNNVPLYGIQLFFSRDFKVIANIAAGAVDPTITYIPPEPPIPLPALTLSSVNPVSTSRGDPLTLTGSGFGSTAANFTVVFTTATGSVATAPAAATATTLTVNVPSTAITGPVFVLRTSDGRFTGSKVLQVTQNSSTAIQSAVTVTTGQTTLADIYVAPPAAPGPVNATAIGLTAVGFNGDVSLAPASVEIQRGQTRWLWIIGDGASIANGTTVTISGAGVTVAPAGVGTTGGIIVSVTASANATAGPRNIVLTNTNMDTSVFTGGLIIR